MEKIEEMRFPQMAGSVEIRITKTLLPYRKGNKIFLSNISYAKFFWLANKTQFLFYIPNRGIWFGGTDENAFLTQIEYEAHKILVDEGEKKFFRALVPVAIREWQERFGYAKPQRQGDIWAIPIGMSFKDLSKAFFIASEGEKLALISVKNRRIFRTRHKISGSWIENRTRGIVYSIDADKDAGNFMICQGVLSSPNHKPLKLVGLHIVAQTNLLLHPSAAD